MLMMKFPWQFHLSFIAYLLKNKIKGRKKFPMVLMLEPLHLCNLACDGCGRIREYEETIHDFMPLEKCLAAVDESGAPVVSICGGEPLIYPKIDALVEGIVNRKRHLYLCTNGINLERHLPRWKPTPYLTINVSMDGLAKTHDQTRGRKGLYQLDVRAIKAAKAQGFRVVTNTTVYKETEVLELEKMFEELSSYGVDGFLVAPAYHYEALADEDIFMTRKEVHEKFKQIERLSAKYRFFNSPPYLRFLTGERHFDCTPWGNVTVNPQGWKGPCYLITDAHYASMEQMFRQTEWEKYEKRQDPRCEHCMMHCSVEPTVARQSGTTFRDLIEIFRWNFS
jgi:hopanoid biosynthesis associated radical SAM protein HpnH